MHRRFTGPTLERNRGVESAYDSPKITKRTPLVISDCYLTPMIIFV